MTALPWSTRCIKYLLFIFNLLFAITGVILVSVGATIHGVYGNYSEFLDAGYMSTSAFVVATGMIIFVISFFGCCGAVKENFCMTLTFTCLLIIIFIFELAAGISGYVLRDGTRTMITNNFHSMMKNYNSSREDAKTIDVLQQSFKCCGAENYTDWYNYLPGNNSVPISCCMFYGAYNNITCAPGQNDFSQTPCVAAFGNFIEDHAVTIGGLAIGLAFVQLIGILFSCHLSKQIKLNYHSV